MPSLWSPEELDFEDTLLEVDADAEGLDSAPGSPLSESLLPDELVMTSS